MKLTLLGTGTPAPSLTRQSSGYLIDVVGDVLVWDHGPGSHQRLLEGGRRATEVTHAFFTHLHYDHCMDYARLVLSGGSRRGQDPDLPLGPRRALRRAETVCKRGHPRPDRKAHRVFHRRSTSVTATATASDEITPDRVIQGEAEDRRPRATRSHSRVPCVPADGRGTILFRRRRLYDPSSSTNCDVLVLMNHHYSGTEASPAFRACSNHEDNAMLAARS